MCSRTVKHERLRHGQPASGRGMTRVISSGYNKVKRFEVQEYVEKCFSYWESILVQPHQKGSSSADQGPLGSFECPSGGDFKLTADRIRKELVSQAGISAGDISRTVATGYGSKLVTFADETKSDIVCHGKGVSSLLPSARTVIDVGDLYTKVFRIDGRGGVHKFLLSGKCAGGSGRILQVIAKVLQVRVEEIGELS